MRFLLAEFGHVTGLPCGEFDEGYVVDDQERPKKGDFMFWDRLLGVGSVISPLQMWRRWLQVINKFHRLES